MKIVLVIACTLVGVFIAFQVYTVMATEKSETQAYKVAKIEKDFEIRHYPSVAMAMITSSAKTYRELGSYGFRKLAGYIFGGNKDKKQIAMTAPVHMDIGDTESSMSFVMPSIEEILSIQKKEHLDLVVIGIKETQSIVESQFTNIITDLIKVSSAPLLIIPERSHFKLIKK